MSEDVKRYKGVLSTPKSDFTITGGVVNMWDSSLRVYSVPQYFIFWRLVIIFRTVVKHNIKPHIVYCVNGY